MSVHSLADGRHLLMDLDGVFHLMTALAVGDMSLTDFPLWQDYWVGYGVRSAWKVPRILVFGGNKDIDGNVDVDGRVAKVAVARPPLHLPPSSHRTPTLNSYRFPQFRPKFTRHPAPLPTQPNWPRHSHSASRPAATAPAAPPWLPSSTPTVPPRKP